MSATVNDGDALRRFSEGCDPPQVSSNDLFAFFEAHFSDAAVAQFGGTFLNPENGYEPQEEYWDEEDGLGYYEDGVKRTLTDEQIEIFRHSELQTLRRQQEKETENSKDKREPSLGGLMKDLEDGSSPHEAASPSASRSNKKRRKKGGGRPRPEPKPDLRKRTWDVVEKGLDSLDYD